MCVITNGYCTTTSATWSPCQQTCGPCGGCDSVQYSSVPERDGMDESLQASMDTKDMNRLCSLASAVLMQTNPCSIINRLPSSHFAPPASKFVLLPLPGWSTPWLDCGSLTCMPPRSSPRLSHSAAPIRARRAQSPDARSDQSRGLPSRWGGLMRPCYVPSRLLSVCFCPDY